MRLTFGCVCFPLMVMMILDDSSMTVVHTNVYIYIHIYIYPFHHQYSMSLKKQR